MEFYGIDNLNNEQDLLLKKVLKFFRVNYIRKVAMIFDKKDYSDKNSSFDCLGFCLDINTGLPDDTPNYINEIIYENKIEIILFFSHQTLNLSGIEFVWVLAHELRHLEQNCLSKDITLVGSLLYNNLGDLFPQSNLYTNMIPTEYDSDYKALK